MKFSYWLVFLLSSGTMAQDLTLLQIMDDPIWMGKPPGNITLSEEDGAVYFGVPQAMPDLGEQMRYDLETGKLTKVETDKLSYARLAESHEGASVTIHEVAGDLWISKKNQKMEPMISRTSRLRFVRFIDGNRFVFREDDNLYLFHVDTGQMHQLTHFAFRDEPEEKETLYRQEEKKLFDYIEGMYEWEEQREARTEKERQMGSLSKPTPIYLGKKYDVGRMFIPDDNRLMVDVSEDLAFASIVVAPESNGEPTEYAEFINKDGEVQTKKSRPRVGHPVKTWKLGILNRVDQKLSWLDLSKLPEIETDRLAEIKEGLTEEQKKFLPKESKGPREVRLVSGGFQPGGRELLVTVYSADSKDQWIILVNPETMEYRLADHHYDPAWIHYFMRHFGSGPRHSSAAFWRKDGEKFMYLSDKSGYQHLYGYDIKSGKIETLTAGDFEVYSPFEDESGKNWYFHSNRKHPGEIHFYRMNINGGKWDIETSEPGHHEVTRGKKLMVELFSKTNLPPVVRVKKGNKEGWKTVYDGRSEDFKKISWIEPEVLSYKNRDGKQVYARLYKPEKPNGAGVVFVHGAGYLQNAHKGWSDYFREYMFHNLLAQQGYTILDPDYQASAGYGRDWRTAIYRYMGDKDLTDVLDGAGFLVEQHGVDAQRIGVYGGSYGGFITLMALFTAPEVFRSGAALRPVTDWAYYNHWYTARILNTPMVDPEAYHRSSPIYFADGLQGSLLICHGMVDDNVYYQDSVRLAQRLIELRKHNWELSSYPVEPHGFRTPSSWYDEYRRIYELFQKTLN